MNNANSNKLSADRLLNTVIDEQGLDDFGDEHFVRDYKKSIDAINEEIELSSGGLAILEELVQRLLTNRLRIEGDFKAHPEIEDEVLAPPVVVTGAARTGTTKLQRLLSSVSHFQSLALWKLLNPAPFPESTANDPDPRIAWTEYVVGMIKENYPEAWAAHPTPALDVDEDFRIHDLTFIAPTLPMSIGAEGLLDECTPIDDRVYQYLRKVLKYLQWQNGATDRASKPWVLKSPIHLGNLSALQRVFPGTKVVHCHRDVEVSMASLCRLYEVGQRMLTDELDLKSMASGALNYWAKEWERNIEQRQQIDSSLYCDIKFEDINKNPLAIVEQIYSFLDMKFDRSARTAILKWESENQRHKHGRHVYDAVDYGLSSSRVRTAFESYFTYFAESDIIGG